MWTVIHADAIDALKTMDGNQFDSVVTDPPYGLSNTDPDKVVRAITHWLTDDRAYVPSGKGFMGKKWDEFVPPPAVWDEVFRVLKPGAHALVFAGTRTHGLMEISMRLAGFDIRDSIDWIYGSGFPKSRDISKAIDEEAGAEREVIGPPPYARGKAGQSYSDTRRVSYDYDPQPITAPATEAAKQWEGWGTALKPAHEPIIVARKPLAKGRTVAANVLEYGTGGINVDGCRVAGPTPKAFGSPRKSVGGIMNDTDSPREQYQPNSEGRWPPNILLSDEAAEEMDRQSGISTSRVFPVFKYNAKASKKERPVVEGLPGHPTVKPVALMQWLVKLVTQPGGTVLDPFAGTGTTAEACELEGMNCVLIESDPDSIRRIDKRMEKYEEKAG